MEKITFDNGHVPITKCIEYADSARSMNLKISMWQVLIFSTVFLNFNLAFIILFNSTSTEKKKLQFRT